MKRLKIIFLLLIVFSSSIAATYTGTKPKDLDITTPTESNTKVSEFNNSDREIKIVITNLENLTTVTGTYTVAGTQTGILGSSTSSYTISFPAASTLATGSITKKYMVKNINTGTITLNLTVDGVGSPTVTGSQTMCIFTDGTSWFETRVRTAAVSSDTGLLDGLDSTHFTNATNLSTGTVALARIPGTLTGKSADLLDEQDSTYFTNSSNQSSGTIPLARIPTTLTGKDADTLDTYHASSFVKTTDDYVSRATAGLGISLSGNTGSVTITNSGVRGVIAGTGISVDQATGSVTVTNSGVTQIVAGGGIAVTGGGIGAVTVTASGTSSAGGWTEGATQTVATAGLRIVAQGTIAVHANYGITGLADAWIPNDISLDSFSQITTRNYDIISGTSTIKPTQIAIGTTTLQGALNAVGSATLSGTITAGGFSGNGAGLTGLTGVAFSAVTGSATASQIPLLSSILGSATATQLPLNAAFVGTQNVLGTITQWNNSVVTIYGTSNTSPLSVVVNTNYIGTNTTAIMTGTSTPSPNQVLASSVYSAAYQQHEAFDGVISGGANNGWAAITGANEWIEYDYGTETKKGLKQYIITCNIADIGGAGNAPTAFDLRGSNDRLTYTSIDARSGVSFGALESKTYTIATSTTPYQFYRLHVTTSGAASVTIGELQLIGETGDRNTLHVTGSGTVLVNTTFPNGTSNAYVFQIAGSGLGTSWGVTCYEAIKSIIGSGSAVIKEGYDAVMGTELFKSHPKIRDDITIEQAEEVAKREYVKSFQTQDYETFKTDRIAEYIADKGTDTANWTQLRTDFETEYVEPRKDEFYVLADKDERVSKKKIEMESDTSITNITPVSDDPSTPNLFKRGDPRILDLQPQIGALMGAVQKLDEMIKTQDAEIKDLKKKMGIP